VPWLLPAGGHCVVLLQQLGPVLGPWVWELVPAGFWVAAVVCVLEHNRARADFPNPHIPDGGRSSDKLAGQLGDSVLGVTPEGSSKNLLQSSNSVLRN
jgi:hypothetical protein